MAVRETRGSSASNGQQQQQPQQQQRTLPPRAGHPRRNALRKPVRTAERLDLSTLKMDFDPTDEVPKAQRPMGLQEAPTYWPSEKQWADPLAYIQSIADEGQKYGIIKVVPPTGWRPQFSVDTERFFFRTRKQELNSMEGATRSNMSYMDKLSKFHRQQGTPLVRPPAIDKQPIDLYLLKRAVDTRGSFTAVCSNKQWAEIGRELGFGATKNVTSVPSSLKNAYQKYLQPYETYLEKAKPDFLREMGLTPSPQQERKMDAKTSPGGMRRVLLSEFQKPDGTSADERMSEVDDVKPSVKSETPEALEEMKDVTPTPSQYGLKRPFEEMRTTRSASTSTENDKEDQPTRRESKRIKAATAPTVVGSNMAQHAHSNKPSRMGGMHSMHSSAAKKPGENCEVCGRGDNALSMLLCDGCDTGYHTFCLDPPLKSIPKYDWFCAQCLVGTNEFGFEDGDEYSLSQFRQKADSFRQEYIEKNFTPEARVRGVVTENQVEEEFWRMVSNIEETVEVDYGADIHSTTHGSGFPTVETHPTDSYSTDPWNLNILPLDNQSLFRHIKSDVSGMTVPWLYVGMMFSTFCWHNEDHYCYSINYQHFGATKTWYGIPGSDSEKFEQAMRNAVPELFETQPDLLFQLVTMLSPGRLVEEGVNVYAVDQRPNQFVITFPQAYHAGFNHGFNMNEAVNFAPSDWEEYGRDCVERYREYRKMPVFSHDELLITAALHDSSIKTAKWLTSAMDILVERELQSRKAIREKFDLEETIIEEDLPSDEYYQCSVCKAYNFLSQITCACTTNAVCGEHVAELCDCDITTRVYRLWCLDQDLVDLSTKISDRAKIPEIWSQKYKALTEEYERPPLKNLRTLLAEAERIQYHLPELATLKAFVEHANEWVEDTTAFVARKHQNRRKNERVWRAGSKVQELEERDRIQRNPEYVYKLLDEASRLAFEAPEIESLREKLEAIEEFQERGEKALNEGTLNSLEEYSELIDEGKSLNVDLPVLDRLERITDQLRWVEKATDVTDVYLSLNEVLELMDEGERAGISVDHELMRQLASRRDKGRWWEEAASRLLGLESIPLEALVSLLDSATDLSIHKETYDKAESIILKVREVSQHMESLLARTIGPEKPPLSEAMRLLKLMNELPIKSSESAHFRKLVGKAEDWVKHGKRLFGKMNASIHQLEDHLLYVQNRNEKVFNVADVPRREDEAQDSESGPYCICRSGPTGQMVECDICKEWYHLKCLKISNKKFDPQEGWDCPICDWRKAIPRTATRPVLTELKEWIQAADQLAFRPVEVEVVRSIIERAERWVAAIRPIVHSEHFPSVDVCRFYLRKIEGAEVFLAGEFNYFRKALHALAPVSATPPPSASETRVLVKKARPRKPKMDAVLQNQNGPLPRIAMPRRQYESQPLMPYSGPLDHPPPSYGHYPPYPSNQPYGHNPGPLPPLPPKGVFPPPAYAPTPYRESHGVPVDQRPPMDHHGMDPQGMNHHGIDHQGIDRVSVCGSCNIPFTPGPHQQPSTCSVCKKYQHHVCIGRYGGRLYPQLVCGECEKRPENQFQTLPPVPVKRPPLPPSWGVNPPPANGPQYVTSDPKSRAVIDLTNSPSPAPEASPLLKDIPANLSAPPSLLPPEGLSPVDHHVTLAPIKRKEHNSPSIPNEPLPPPSSLTGSSPKALLSPIQRSPPIPRQAPPNVQSLQHESGLN